MTIEAATQAIFVIARSIGIERQTAAVKNTASVTLIAVSCSNPKTAPKETPAAVPSNWSRAITSESAIRGLSTLTAERTTHKPPISTCRLRAVRSAMPAESANRNAARICASSRRTAHDPRRRPSYHLPSSNVDRPALSP